MIKDTIKEIIRERIRIADETEDNWDYGIEQCWKQCTEIFSANIPESVDYFLNQCTDEELYWLSEDFENIAERTQSRDLLIAWQNRLNSVLPKNYDQSKFESNHMRNCVDYSEYYRSIEQDIKYAEGKLNC